MNVVIYTNCQGSILNTFLKKVLPIESSHHLVCHDHFQYKLELPVEILSKCDLFIYQIIDKKHGIYNTENDSGILSLLKPNCKKLSFPSIYANIFPLFFEGDRVVGGESILKLKDQGYTLHQIIHMYKNYLIDFNLKHRFLSSMQHMKNKEKYCDIILTDFIEENLKKFKIFDTQNHPNGTIIAHLSNKILEILGYTYRFDVLKNTESYLEGAYGYSSYMGKELGIVYDEPETDYTNIIVGLYTEQFKPKIKEYDCW